MVHRQIACASETSLLARKSWAPGALFAKNLPSRDKLCFDLIFKLRSFQRTLHKSCNRTETWVISSISVISWVGFFQTCSPFSKLLLDLSVTQDCGIPYETENPFKRVKRVIYVHDSRDGLIWAQRFSVIWIFLDGQNSFTIHVPFTFGRSWLAG